MKPYVIAAVVILIIVIIFALNSGGGIREKNRVPSLAMWKIIYTDMHTDNRKADVVYSKILHSDKYDLQGKPDYIYKHRITGELMPVEIKSGETEEIHDGDLLQVGAYMLIVWDLYGRKPKKTLICYKNKCFVIKNTYALRKNVIDTAERMRKMLKTGIDEPNASFVNCRPCICNGTVCPFSEADYDD